MTKKKDLSDGTFYIKDGMPFKEPSKKINSGTQDILKDLGSEIEQIKEDVNKTLDNLKEKIKQIVTEKESESINVNMIGEENKKETLREYLQSIEQTPNLKDEDIMDITLNKRTNKGANQIVSEIAKTEHTFTIINVPLEMAIATQKKLIDHKVGAYIFSPLTYKDTHTKEIIDDEILKFHNKIYRSLHFEVWDHFKEVSGGSIENPDTLALIIPYSTLEHRKVLRKKLPKFNLLRESEIDYIDYYFDKGYSISEKEIQDKIRKEETQNGFILLEYLSNMHKRGINVSVHSIDAPYIKKKRDIFTKTSVSEPAPKKKTNANKINFIKNERKVDELIKEGKQIYESYRDSINFDSDDEKRLNKIDEMLKKASSIEDKVYFYKIAKHIYKKYIDFDSEDENRLDEINKKLGYSHPAPKGFTKTSVSEPAPKKKTQ